MTAQDRQRSSLEYEGFRTLQLQDLQASVTTAILQVDEQLSALAKEMADLANERSRLQKLSEALGDAAKLAKSLAS